jgi:hypothetical protein
MSTEPDRTVGALDVHCPACNALPGQPCTAPTVEGRRAVQWVHNARRDLADGWT